MKIALNAQQLAATHSLPQILEVFELHGIKAIELWTSNLNGSSQTPEEHERFETKDIDATRQLIREHGFEVACVTLGFHAAPLCIATRQMSASNCFWRHYVPPPLMLPPEVWSSPWRMKLTMKVPCLKAFSSL
jgi:hypothetical protein